MQKLKTSIYEITTPVNVEWDDIVVSLPESADMPLSIDYYGHKEGSSLQPEISFMFEVNRAYRKEFCIVRRYRLLGDGDKVKPWMRHVGNVKTGYRETKIVVEDLRE